MLTLAAALAPLVLPAAGVEYERHRLFELAGRSEHVVVGQVGEVRGTTYDLHVDEWLVGGGPSVLSVARFRDWTCAARWAPYETGQRVLLFLVPSGELGGWGAVGAGNEGDVPLEGSDALLPWYGVHGYTYDRFELGRGFDGTRVPLDELGAALRGFHEALSWKGGTRPITELVEPRVEMERVRAWAASSRVARHLFEEAYSSHGWPHSPVETEQVEGSLPRVAPWLAAEASGELAFLGDVDGDGVDEWLVGLPHGGSGRAVGELCVASFRADGEPLRATFVGADAGGFRESLGDGATFGAAVAALGDLDGNGVPDFAVGAPGHDGARERLGGTWVLFAQREGYVTRTRDASASPELAALTQFAPGPSGWVPRQRFGAALATLGDLDGDGSVELAVAREGSLSPLAPHVADAAFVLSVDHAGDVARAAALPPPADRHRPGRIAALAAPGDVDGDGVPDLALGYPSCDDGGDSRGAVRIVFLGVDGAGSSPTAGGEQRISDWEGDFDGLLFDRAEFGRALGAPGDVDGDGVPDLIVSSEQGLWLLLLTRRGTVREHREIRDSRHGFTDVGVLDGAIACAPEWDAGGTLRMVVAGRAGEGRRRERALWLLRLRRDGTVSGW